MRQHRTDIGVLAVKSPEHGPVILRVPARQDRIAEALAIGAVQAAMGGEPGIGIIRQHHRPLVGVIAAGIAVGPDVQKITGAIARRHVGEIRGGFFQRPGLEAIHILPRRACRQRVPLHVELRGRQKLAQGVALAPFVGGLDLVHQALRNHRAAFVIHRIMLEHFGIERPVLVELGGKFDKVARHIGA